MKVEQIMGINFSNKKVNNAKRFQVKNAWSGGKVRKNTTEIFGKNATIKTLRFASPVVIPISPKKPRFFPKKIKLLQRGTKENFMYNGSFHEAMAPVIIMSQCFGMMPVIGVKSKNTADLHFTWKSFRTWFSVMSFIATGFYMVLTILWAFSEKIEFSRVVPIIFYSSSFYGIFCFGILAKQWPSLMKQWREVEQQLTPLKLQQEKGMLAYKIKMITILVMMLSLVEHLLSLITNIHFANTCPNVKDSIESFFRQQCIQLFMFTEYSHFKAIIGKCINIISTFIWSYMDCFVMLISVGLSSIFKQINKELMSVKGKPVSEEFWGTQRVRYRKLCDLCETVDDSISRLTMVSFSNNLFFICVQLLNSLNPMRSFAHALYFWFSLIFLIGRTLAVSLYSADIHDESKKPIEIFRAVPNDSWCLEVKRFAEEVTSDMVALTGMKFFYLTRRLVLSVAGTIVTYELVLIQFHQDEELSDNDPCMQT